MQDVADLASVSRTTVSFVLNERTDANIPAATQQRVLDAVKTLGYRPNVIARGLRAQRTSTIGFISDTVATTPFAGQIIQGAQDKAWEQDYLLLLVSTGGDQRLKKVGVESLLDRQVDGIIYATMYHRQVNPPAAIADVPTVLLDCFTEGREYPSVVPDEVRGGYEAVRHLIQKGHRRIGFINDAAPVQAHLGRWKGYRKALDEAGLPYDDALVAVGVSEPGGGYDAAMTLLDRPEPPTALFVFNDRMAMGVYDAARTLDLTIPDDLAIVGFDNHEVIAAYLYPPLSTMQLPHYEMGRWAVEHLLQLIQGEREPSNPPLQHLVHCPIVERASA